MSLLITGAAGWLGKRFAKVLCDGSDYDLPIKSKRKVKCLVMKNEDSSELKTLGCDIFYGDIRDKNSIKKAFQGVETVFHLAGLIHPKRRHELILLGNEAYMHRSVLKHYNAEYLDQVISIVTSATVISYILYTMSPSTIEKYQSKMLILSVPFVLYGIFRYLYLVYKKGEGGDPSKSLLSDYPLLIGVVFLFLSMILIIGFKI